MATAEFGRVAGNASAEQLPLASTADQLEVWFRPDIAGAETPLYSSIGDRLPPVAFSLAAFNWLQIQAETEEISIMQRRMLDSTAVSPVTGCWLPADPNRYRAAGGYIPCGDKASGVNQSGSTLRHRANYQRHNLPLGEQPLTSEDDIDHICRNTACGCPWHFRRMGGRENNELKDLARNFELALMLGNTILPNTGKEWLDPVIESSNERFIDVTIATRFGAFALERLDGDILAGVAIPCPIRDSLREPAPYRHGKKKFEVSEGQLQFSEPNVYTALLDQVVSIPTPLAA